MIQGVDSNIEEDANEKPGQSNSTPHTNQGWQDHLRMNLQEVIVDQCSKVAMEAFKNNEDIQVVEKMTFAYNL